MLGSGPKLPSEKRKFQVGFAGGYVQQVITEIDELISALQEASGFSAAALPKLRLARKQLVACLPILEEEMVGGGPGPGIGRTKPR